MPDIILTGDSGSTITLTTPTAPAVELSGAVLGPPGATGATGPAGTNGVGVPIGGTTGQILAKNSGINYDTGWVNEAPTTPTGSAGGDLGSTYPNPTVTATHLASALPVAQGGTGQTTVGAADIALGVEQVLVPGLVGNGVTDDSTAISAALATINVTTAPTEVLVVSPIAGGSIYINQEVAVITSNTKLRFGSPIIFGPNGYLRLDGKLVYSVDGFLPSSGSINSGDTTITLATGTVASVGFLVGQYIEIRGNRDAFGNILFKDYAYITAIAGDVLTINTGVSNAYNYSYSNSYGGGNPYNTVKTEIVYINGSPMTGGATRGSTVLTVNDSSQFAVGNFVLVNDSTLTWNPGTSAWQPSDYTHREIAEVKAIVDATHVQISHALHHTYTLSNNAQVSLLSPIIASEISGVRATWTGGVSSGTAKYGIQVEYGVACRLRDIQMVGSGPQASAPWGNSWYKQAIRLYGSYFCSVQAVDLRAPARVDSGNGYGVTLYQSNYCSVEDVHCTTLRHSILLFDGSAGNLIKNIRSEDVGYSDLDLHGSENVDNLFADSIVIGGSSLPMTGWTSGSGPVYDTNPTKAACRVGDPSHVPGDKYNVFDNILCVNLQGYAVEVVAGSTENEFRNFKVNGAIGAIFLETISGTDGYGNPNTLNNHRFNNWIVSGLTGTNGPVQIGGSAGGIAGLFFDNIRVFGQSYGWSLNGASDVVFRNCTMEDATPVSGQYAYKMQSIAGLTITHCNANSFYNFMSAQSCTNTIVIRNDIFNLTNGKVYQDNGGNTGLIFDQNSIYGFTPTVGGTFSGAVLNYPVLPNIDSATSSTVGGVQLAGDLSGSATSPTVLTSNGAVIMTLSGNQTVTGGKTFNANLNMADGANLAFGTVTGTKIGTSVSQLLAFYNSTPITKPSGNVSVALSSLGLISSPTIAEADITNLTTDLAAKATDSLVVHLAGTETITGSKTFSANLNMADGKDITFGTSSGGRIANSSSQLLGFWGKTPIVRPSGDILAALGTASGMGLISSPTISEADVTNLVSDLALLAPLASAALTGTPTAPTASAGTSTTQLATTQFVANAVLGQDFKQAAKYATTAALPAIVYNNGSSGVGATLTAVSFGAVTFDGSTPSVGDRVLIKNQASTLQNGIYTVTTVGGVATLFVLTRATDFNQSAEINQGDSLFVTSGSTLGATTWAVNSGSAPTIGTDPITFAQVAGPGSYTAGNGIAITATSIAIDTSVTVDKTTTQALTNKDLTGSGNTFPTFNQNTTGTAANITGVAAVANGGTGASTVANARTNLSLSAGGASTYTVGASGADYTDIQSALNAVGSNGGTIYVLDGTYTVTSTLLVKQSGTRIICGSGVIVQCDGSSVTPLIKPNTTGLVKIVIDGGKWLQTNATIQGVGFDFSDSANHWIEHVSVESFGTGYKLYDTVNTTYYNSMRDSRLFDCNICVDISAANINLLSNVRMRPKAGGAGKAVNLVNSRSIEFNSCDMEPATGTGITGVAIDGNCRDCVFVNCWIENNDTNVNVASGANRTTFIGCSITSPVTTNITDSGTQTAFIGTDDNGAVRNNPGPFSGTLTTNDIAMRSGSALRTATSAGNSAKLSAFNTGSSSYTVFATLTANATPTMDLSDSVTKAGSYIYRAGGTTVPITDGGTGQTTAAGIMGALSGQATANFSMNSNKITSLSDPTAATDAANKEYTDTLGWKASDQGLLAWNYDVVGASSTGAALTTAGTLYVMQIKVPKAISVTNIIMYVGAAGNTLTSGQCFAAIYQGATGSLLGTTSDQSGTWNSTGLKTMAISGAPIAVAAGNIYVVVWFNGTTGPAFKANGTANTLMNVGLAAASARWGSADTGRTTSGPGTLGTITATIGASYWVGLS